MVGSEDVNQRYNVFEAGRALTHVNNNVAELIARRRGFESYERMISDNQTQVMYYGTDRSRFIRRSSEGDRLTITSKFIGQNDKGNIVAESKIYFTGEEKNVVCIQSSQHTIVNARTGERTPRSEI